MKKKSLLAYPYIIWSALFIVIPLILVVIFSFTVNVDGKNVFSLANYKDLMDPIYFKVFFRSIILAGLSTLIKIGDDFFYILYFVKLNIIDGKCTSSFRSIFFYFYVSF